MSVLQIKEEQKLKKKESILLMSIKGYLKY